MGNKVKAKLDTNSIEWMVLIAMFRATSEQTTMLTGQPKQRTKVLFNRWIREGEKLLSVIENTSDEEYLDKITETVENEGSNQLREQLTKLEKDES